MSAPARVISEVNRRQLVTGKDFVIDSPTEVRAIFGKGDDVGWAQGESLIVVGPTGVGKGTVLQQLALRRAGIQAGDFLGYPVLADPDRLVLYLALDRPAQIMRSFKRMVTAEHEELLRERLHVWKGALPFDLVKHPELLIEFVHDVEQIAGKTVGTVIADSIKDMAGKLSSDETGGAINRAIALVLAADIEFAAPHHQRKATAENKKPTSLADVYGSTWITAGAGSVILLWGEAGDPIVELSHLKPVAEPLGPFDIEHDHARGITTRPRRADAWSVLQAATDGGVTVADAAQAVYGAKPDKKRTQSIRRKLDRYVKEDHAAKIDPSPEYPEVRYRPIPAQVILDTRAERVPNDSGTPCSTRAQARTEHAPTKRARTPRNTEHASSTPPQTPPPYVVGGGERAQNDDAEHRRIKEKFPEAV